MTEQQIFERLHADSEALKIQGIKIEKLDGKIGALTEMVKQLNGQFNQSEELGKSVQQMAINIAIYSQKVEHLTSIMDNRLETIEDKQKQHGQRLVDVENKPAKRMELIVTTIITSTIGVGIGLLISYLIK